MQSIIFSNYFVVPPNSNRTSLMNHIHIPANCKTSVIKTLKDIISQENETYMPNKNYKNCGRTLLIKDLEPSALVSYKAMRKSTSVTMATYFVYIRITRSNHNHSKTDRQKPDDDDDDAWAYSTCAEMMDVMGDFTWPHLRFSTSSSSSSSDMV